MWLCPHFAGMQIEAEPSHVRVRGGGAVGREMRACRWSYVHVTVYREVGI